MTDAPADILPLAADFPPATREQWRELVDGLLKGAPFERKLVARTYDGLTIAAALCGSRAGARAAGRDAGRGAGRSSSASTIPIRPPPTPRRCTICDNGADRPVAGLCRRGRRLWLRARRRRSSARARARRRSSRRRHGDRARSPARRARMRRAASRRLLNRRGMPAAAADIRFGFDPLGAMAAAGGCGRGAGARPRHDLARAIAELAGAGFTGPFAVADGRVDPQCRRLRSAGTRLRARGRGRLSARAGSLRHGARRGARA